MIRDPVCFLFETNMKSNGIPGRLTLASECQTPRNDTVLLGAGSALPAHAHGVSQRVATHRGFCCCVITWESSVTSLSADRNISIKRSHTRPKTRLFADSQGLFRPSALPQAISKGIKWTLTESRIHWNIRVFCICYVDDNHQNMPYLNRQR